MAEHDVPPSPALMAVNAALALGLIGAGAASLVGPVPQVPVVVALVVLAWLNRRSLNRPARVIGCLVTVLFVGAWVTGWPSSSEAVARAAFLSAFLLSLGMLSNAASRSSMFRRAARIVASRPRGARYVFVTLGTHIFAIFLNFGAASLMATLLSQSRETIVRQNALEDLTLAILRGFAAMPMWSPLALSTIITLSILPEVGYFELLPLGIAAAVVYIGAGYLLTRGRSPQPDLAGVLPSRADQLVLGRVVALVALLVAVAFSLHRLAMLSMPASVLVAVLIFSVSWWALQAWEGMAPPLHHELAFTAEAGVNEIVIVSGAGFLGALIAEAITTFQGALLSPPSAAIPAIIALVPAAMVGAGLWAINPIVSASILLGVLHPLVPEPALVWLALAAIVGWGITAASSPFTANVLITTRILNLEAGRMARLCNRTLTLLALVMIGLTCAAASFLSL